MSNDLSCITEETDENDFPYLIWYPNWADWAIYKELVHRKPSMKPQAERTCIVANYEALYHQIEPTPDWFLVHEAQGQAYRNAHYLEERQRRSHEMDIDVTQKPDSSHGCWKILDSEAFYRPRVIRFPYDASPVNACEWGFDQLNLYNDCDMDMSALEMYACAPQEIRDIRRDSDPLEISDVHELTRQSNTGLIPTAASRLAQQRERG